MFHWTREQSLSSFYGFEFSRFVDKYILYQTTSFQFQFFLAVANYGKDSRVQGNSTIFKWHKRRKRFKEFQIIPTWTARDFEHFVMNDKHYLAVANHAKGIIYTLYYYYIILNYPIYDWNCSSERIEEVNIYIFFLDLFKALVVNSVYVYGNSA